MAQSSEARNLFDHLYSVFCNNLRELGKASSFCELIKNANSDLKRITALSKVCNIVLLIKSAKKCMKNNTKNVQRAQDILDVYYDKKDECSESVTDLIVLLNTALVNVTIEDEWNFEQIENFEGDNEGKFIENLLVDSIERVPTFDESLLSEIYGERATYFYDVSDYEMCLLESIRGIYYGKINKIAPNESIFPLLYLICSSLKQLNQLKKASNVLQLSIQLLRKSSLDNAAKSMETIKLVKLMKEIQELTKQEVGIKPIGFNLKSLLQPKAETLPKISVTSDVLVGASSSLALKWDADRGRHIVATETIPLGTTIITERPFASIVHPKNSFSFCQNCCDEAKNVVTCKDCSAAVYCSTQCRSACQAYHQYECKFMKTFTTSEVLGDKGLLCYRTICKTDLRTVESHAREYSDFEKQITKDVSVDEMEESLRNKFIFGVDKSGKLDPQNYTSSFVQTPNSTARLGGDLLKRSFSAIFLTICLRFAGYFDQAVSDMENGKLYEIEQLVASVLLRHLQSATCNSYAINSVNGSNPRRIQINETGIATYPIISTINHSCNQNVHRFTMGNVCVVKTLREIQCGDEIVDSYGPHFASNAMEDRIRFLDGQYLFCCNCQPCNENWPVYSKLLRENLCIRCTQCDGKTSFSGKGKNVCLQCSSVCETKKVIRSIKEMEKKFQEAKQRVLSSTKMSTNERETVHGDIVRYARALEKTQKWPSQTLIECQEALKLCWNLECQ